MSLRAVHGLRLPPAFHLPGIPVGTVPTVWRIGDTPLQVPELGAADVERVWRRMEVAAAVWRGQDLDARVEIVAHAMQQLGARGPGPWREALAASAGLSPAGTDAAWETTFAVHDAGALREALQRERLDAAQLAVLERAGQMPQRLVHVLSGNVLPPTLALLLRGWLLGAAQWLRPAAREPVFAASLLADLVDTVPELAACTAVCWWPHAESTLADAVLRAAQVVTVNGSDAAVDAVRSRCERAGATATFVGYGSRWSAALVSAAAQTQPTAHALAADVALFDQQGCLSPSLVFAERNPRLGAWCAALAAELAGWEERMPRGPAGGAANAALRHWHETARLDRTLGVLEGFWESERAVAWGVACCARAEVYDTPLDRHVVVVPFERLEEIEPALAARLHRLQGLVLEADGWPESRRDAAVARMHPTRVSRAGSLQRAPLGWRQDHRAPFGSLLLA